VHENCKLIGDYAVIGDCRTAALVRDTGAIDWFCCPRFDSPAVFAALVGTPANGHWTITPTAKYSSSRQYVGASNVLCTTFNVSSGAAELIDGMPVFSETAKRNQLVAEHEILRELRCTDGEVEFAMEFCLRPNYGSDRPRLRPSGKLGIRLEVGRGLYWLRSSHEMACSADAALATVKLRHGETAQFSLSYSENAPAVLPLLGEAASERLRGSVEWWSEWANRASYDGPYRDAVVRSALALKLLTYAPSGAIVAAPTTSLPERIGSDLNWDYRYCWLRDASMTVGALLGLGYWDEAEAFVEWMLHATRLTQPKFDVMYTVYGLRVPRERELKHLPGFAQSRPVRIGNGAREQLQLDVYGEVIEAASHLVAEGHEFDHTTCNVLLSAGEYVMKHWGEPDDGIWEPRSGRVPHTHSRVLCWTALHTLSELSEHWKLAAAAKSFAQEAELIREDIEKNAWNPILQSYASTLGGSDMDATLLLMARYGFIDARHPRMRSTYARVVQSLRAGAATLYRYAIEPPEGAFAICGFWEVEYLALAGEVVLARQHFERLLTYANDVGLFAEEIDTATGAPLGNYPQAFTHIGLIGAALAIERAEKEAVAR
jgi:GH15 family glucan-1,4-alpha-glucosidase